MSFASNSHTELMSAVGRNEKTMAIAETNKPQNAASLWPNFQAAAKI